VLGESSHFVSLTSDFRTWRAWAHFEEFKGVEQSSAMCSDALVPFVPCWPGPRRLGAGPGTDQAR
jgi:hypothetical protein